MFIGHFGIGFGAKPAAPRVSLGTLFFAARFVDLLRPTLLLLSLERVRIDPTTWVGQAQWPIALWEFWIDRHRISA